MGSHIDEAGILRELFGLIPLFWLLQLLGALVFLITFYRYRNKE